MDVERCAAGFADPASDGLSRKRNRRRKAVRAFVSIVLNGNWLLRSFARESWNISHKDLGEVKEILEKLGDDSFGNRLSG